VSPPTVILVAALFSSLLGCSSPDPREPYPTRLFTYRGAELGGSCAAALQYESSIGGKTVQSDFNGLDRYGVIDFEKRSALIECREGVLCSQSITHYRSDKSHASQLCSKLRNAFTIELGQPDFDFQSEPLSSDPSDLGIIDPDNFRPVVWDLSHSRMMLDCPLQPNGQGYWTVSISHDTNPQLVAHEAEPNMIVVSPANACLPSE